MSEDTGKQCDLHGACGSSEKNSVSDFSFQCWLDKQKGYVSRILVICCNNLNNKNNQC